MPKIRSIVVGTGGMAQWHIKTMLRSARTTKLVGFVEVSEASRERTRKTCADEGKPCPPFYTTIQELVKAQGAPDAAFICTPHKFHYGNAVDCMKAGMDVLMEKPMVMNASEARRLIALRKKTRRLFVIAFPGSLSPAIHKAKQLIQQGKIGKVTHITGYAQQWWKELSAGGWRQDPEISGGGFLFDTGSHLINTVVDLAGEDVIVVTALQDHCGAPVDINSSVAARTASGIMLTLAGAGNTILCESNIQVFGTKGVIETGIWGERLRIKTAKDRRFAPVKCPKSMGVWEQFVTVRQGRLRNPCPPEIGLRFSRLMDMIRKSAETGRTVRSRKR